MLDEEWVRLLNEAYLCARGERFGELRGRRQRRFDASGLHPFSFILGKLATIEWMLELPAEVCAHPVALVKAAREDAERIFAQQVASGESVFG